MKPQMSDLVNEPGVQELLDSGLAAGPVADRINALMRDSDNPGRTSESSVKRWRQASGYSPPAPDDEPAQLNTDDLPVRYEELRRKHDSTLRRLSQAKASKQELVDAVYRASSEAAAALKVKPVPAPALSKGTKATEVAVVVLSDWQLAKVTPSYNSRVCEERIERFANHVLKITEIQRADHPVKDCHIFGLGDLIEGELIFPGQHYLIDASLYRQVCVDGPRILGNFIRKMLANFEKVHFHGVIGNHGAIGGRERRNMNPESNGDRMLYRITQQLLDSEPRITWDIPDGDSERNWYTVATIGNYSSLLIHGDQLRGYGGMPWYGLQKKVGGWRLGAIPENFKDVYFGHYHQPTRVTLSSVTARCAGSPESMNTYAMEQLAAVGYPSQPLMFVHPKKGIVTAEYTCWLDEPDASAATW